MTKGPSTLSHSRGASAPPLQEQTIGAALAATAAAHGGREALVVPHQGVRWTWNELAERADAVTAGLLALGLAPGDRVGIWAPNCAEWALTQFATARAGLVLVNVNPAYRRSELEYALNKVGCRMLVLAPALKTSNYLEIVNDLAPELAGSTPGQLKARLLPDLRWVVRLGSERTPGMLNCVPPGSFQVGIRPYPTPSTSRSFRAAFCSRSSRYPAGGNTTGWMPLAEPAGSSTTPRSCRSPESWPYSGFQK